MVALDPYNLEPISVRMFPADEYLSDPALQTPGGIRHCRGIAQSGPRLYAALFNGVREYAVDDARSLSLRPGRLFTDPRAVDLHGICIENGNLYAASTGSNSVIGWDLQTAAATTVSLSPPRVDGDLRFPDQLARLVNESDWRAVLDADRHINGVSVRDGSMVVCSLTQVLELTGEEVKSLRDDEEGRMHDGCFSGEDDLLLTDGSRGLLVCLDLSSGSCRCTPIADPEDWFVRGVGVIHGRAYVLSSPTMPSRQRGLDGHSGAPAMAGGRFMVSIVDLAAWALVEERLIELEDVAQGSVVYGLVGWNPE